MNNHNHNHNKKVLIVEDDLNFLSILQQAFEDENIQLVFARDGEEGLAMAQKEKPDLIILDLRMPIMDGAEALAKLKSDPDTKDIKVFILSLFNEWAGIKLTKESAVKLGAVDFMEKSGEIKAKIFWGSRGWRRVTPIVLSTSGSLS